jgi:hypothetical protein
MTPEQLPEPALWTVVAVRPDTREIHVVHGPGYPCHITQGLCACCACTTCQKQRAILDEAARVVEPAGRDDAS